MKLLSARTLAERWDVHRDSVYKMIARGDLPCRRISGMVRIPLDAVEAIERGEPWQGVREATGSSNGASEGPGSCAGLRIVASEPEAFAQEILRRQISGSPVSLPNSTSSRGPKPQQ